MNKCFLYFNMLLYVSCIYASWVDTVLQQMNLEEKIAQLIMPGVRLNCPESIAQARQLLAKYQVGGLLLVNVGNNVTQVILTEHMTPSQQAELVKEFQSISRYPLLIGQDLEWGLAMRLRNAPKFPHAMTLGALQNEKLIYDIAYEIGRQAHFVGAHINFAPVIDVNNNSANPIIHDRSFGEDKKAVARKGLLYMQGLRDAGIVACAKHFPGHGNTDVDSHYDLPCLFHTKKELDEIELYPFKKLIKAKVPMIMTAHMHIPALDVQEHSSATLSYSVITQLLRNELGFKGIIITDSLRMKGIMKYFTSKQAAVQAFLAGNDILLDPEDPLEALHGICEAVKKEIIRQQDIDARVHKILSLKYSLGLHTKKFDPKWTDADLVMPYTQELKKEAYRQAITLVCDPAKLIPLAAQKKYAYICSTNIEQEFKNSLSKYVTLKEYNKNVELHLIQEPIVIIPLYGLTRKKENDFGIDIALKKLIYELVKQDKQLIIVVFGTPYSLEILPCEAATIIIAYEDDIDAQQAAADVVTGNLIAQGKLPVLQILSRSKADICDKLRNMNI